MSARPLLKCSLADLNLDAVKFQTKDEIKPWLSSCLMKNKNIHIVIERSDANKIIFRCKNSSKKEIVESKSAKSQVRRQTTCPFKLRANYSLKNKYWSLVVMNDKHDHDIGGAAPSSSNIAYSQQMSHLGAASHMYGGMDDYKRMNPPPQDAFVYGALDYPQIQPIYQQNQYHYNQSPQLQQIQHSYMQPLHQIPVNQPQMRQQQPVQSVQPAPPPLPEQSQLPQTQLPQIPHQPNPPPKSNSDVFNNYMGQAQSLSPVNMQPQQPKDEYMVQGYRKRGGSSSSMSNNGKRRDTDLKNVEEIAGFLRKEVNLLVSRNVVYNSSLGRKDKENILDTFTSQFIMDHADSFSQVFLETMQSSKNGPGAAMFTRTRSNPNSPESHGNTAPIIKTTGTPKNRDSYTPISPIEVPNTYWQEQTSINQSLFGREGQRA